MSTYRIVLMEPDVVAEPDRFVSITNHHVVADTFVEAYAAADQLAADENRVIQQIALTHPRIEIDDAELRVRLLGHLDAEEGYDEETIGWFNGYADTTESFTDYVNLVARALRESGLVPDLTVSLLIGGDGVLDYSMVEVFSPDQKYRALGSEIKNLTNDRTTTGVDAVMAIAWALIGYVNQLR